MTIKLFVLFILIYNLGFMNTVFSQQQSIKCPNNYHYLIGSNSTCHYGNSVLSSGWCQSDVNKTTGIYIGNSSIYSPCPLNLSTLSFGYQQIINNNLTWCTCKSKYNLIYYQVGSCGFSGIEINSTILSFTNEYNNLKLTSCTDTSNYNIFINLSISNQSNTNNTNETYNNYQFNNCINNTGSNFISDNYWYYGIDSCAIGYYGIECKYHNICLDGVCGDANCIDQQLNYTSGDDNKKYDCYCNEGYKLSSNGLHCNIDQCYKTEFELECGSSNCKLINNDKGYECYCDISYKFISNQTTVCELNNGCGESPGLCGTAICKNDKYGNATCVCQDSNSKLSTEGTSCVSQFHYPPWKIPISIIVSIIGVLLLFTTSFFLYKRFLKHCKHHSHNNSSDGYQQDESTDYLIEK